LIGEVAAKNKNSPQNMSTKKYTVSVLANANDANGNDNEQHTSTINAKVVLLTLTLCSLLAGGVKKSEIQPPNAAPMIPVDTVTAPMPYVASPMSMCISSTRYLGVQNANAPITNYRTVPVS